MTTKSQATNAMKRAIQSAAYGTITPPQVARLWAHFDSKCAYCNVPLVRSERKGHLDHLVPGQGDGAWNRILSCGICNGDEKRETEWTEFLRRCALPTQADP